MQDMTYVSSQPDALLDISTIHFRKTLMEAERINTIGNTLDDLRTRTEDLRRYL